jgi:phage tail sheath protein FI
MGTMKTPGVYIVEKNAFPNSVVEVATAVPAFIGYTEKADNKGKSLTNKPWRITSMAEFEIYYGGAPKPKFEFKEKSANSSDEVEFKGRDDKEYILKPVAGSYLLHRCMKLFFQNGGGPCHIISVANYDYSKNDLDPELLRKAVDLLVKEQEPTMVVIPETVLLKDVGASKGVQDAMLQHCGGKMRNRIAMLDIWDGDKEQQDSCCVLNFRESVGNKYLDFATAYYPWVNTTIVQDNELSFENINNIKDLKTLLTGNVEDPSADKSKLLIAAIGNIPEPEKSAPKKAPASPEEIKAAEELAAEADAAQEMLGKSLLVMSPLYVKILGAIKERLNLLPPASAMAGVYTMVDNSRGVWKAPANVSLSAVVSPALNITHDEQEELNVDLNGKSINAIRNFIGEGTLVWGARTLDGNSLDWRYINVRRTMIMLEESIRLASKAYVFEPNVANTWVTMKSMIRNFLTGIWKRGGLAGAVPDDAFSVHVGLGETMTAEDILEGILRITVLVAVSRPAEFIEITFQQQMQKS